MSKNEVKVRAGRLGARARWQGERRIVRLDALDVVTAGIIRAILTAREHAAKAAPDSPPDRAA